MDTEIGLPSGFGECDAMEMPPLLNARLWAMAVGSMPVISDSGF